MRVNRYIKGIGGYGENLNSPQSTPPQGIPNNIWGWTPVGVYKFSERTTKRDGIMKRKEKREERRGEEQWNIDMTREIGIQGKRLGGIRE